MGFQPVTPIVGGCAFFCFADLRGDERTQDGQLQLGKEGESSTHTAAIRLNRMPRASSHWVCDTAGSATNREEEDLRSSLP